MTIHLTDAQFEKHLEEARKQEIRRNPPLVMDVETLSIFLGFHPQTIYQWVETEMIPAHKKGKSIRFELQEVMEWVKGDKWPG